MIEKIREKKHNTVQHSAAPIVRVHSAVLQNQSFLNDVFAIFYYRQRAHNLNIATTLQYDEGGVWAKHTVRHIPNKMVFWGE